MIDPLSLALVGIFTGLIGSGGKALGAAKQGREEAQQARFNAALSKQQAADSRRRGDYAAGLQRQKGTQAIARQRVAAGAGGVAAEGSVLDVMADTRLMAELDALTTANNAAREAWGYEMQAYNYERAGEAAVTRGDSEAAGHLLTGLVNAGFSFGKLGG